MPLAEYVAEVMPMLEQPIPPSGEILAHRARALRWAEKKGEYDSLFAGRNGSRANDANRNVTSQLGLHVAITQGDRDAS